VNGSSLIATVSIVGESVLGRVDGSSPAGFVDGLKLGMTVGAGDMVGAVGSRLVVGRALKDGTCVMPGG
jgi:hypothetical protein